MASIQFTRPVLSSNRLREQFGAAPPTALGTTLGAAFDEPFTTELLLKRAEVIRAERGPLLGARQRATGRFIPAVEGEIAPGVLDPLQQFDLEFGEFKGRVFSVRELNKRYEGLGLTFTRPMGADAAEILANFKRAEIVRRNIIERGPSGVVPFTAQLGMMLLASAMDPLEVASVFIPVVGQARAAGILARRGRVLGRALVGAEEGLVGSALVEPAFAALSKQLQLDYEFSDSLINVALGGLLGAGLGGAIGGAGRLRERGRTRRVVRAVEALGEAHKGQLQTRVTESGVRIKGLKKVVKARTKELDAIRKEVGDKPSPKRKKLALERTAAERELATESKALREAKAELKELEAPEAPKLDTDTKVRALRGAVAQMAQGKSVDVRAVVDPRKVELKAEIKARENQVRVLKIAEKDQLRVVQEKLKAVDAGEEGNKALAKARATRAEIAELRLQEQRTLAELKKRQSVLAAEDAARVAKEESDPARDSQFDPEAEERIVEKAEEKVPEVEELDAEVSEFRKLVDDIRATRELTAAEEAVLAELDLMDKKTAAASAFIKAANKCLRR